MTIPAPWKVEEVKFLEEMINSGEISAVVGIKGIRNRQLQQIRRTLGEKAKLRVARITLLEKAIDGSKGEEIKRLKEVLNGQVAILTANMSPMRLYETIKATEQDSPARGGEVAPQEVIVEAKETSFPPGPMVSEFQKVGLQTAIEKGKIVIKKDTVFVKQGEIISKEKAKILEKLEIHPLRVGLELLGAYSDGLFYPREVISETLADISMKFATAFSQAKTIAMDSMFLVPEIVPGLLVKARLGAENLALETGFVDESNIQLFILKAIKDAAALSASTGEEAESGEEVGKKEEETKEEQKPSDEDVSAGLGALFG